jgi:glucosamine-6-phosphate deaminase
MGVGSILKAKKIIILISGKEKAEALKQLLSGKITTKNPSTMLNMHRDVTVIADEEALELIK